MVNNFKMEDIVINKKKMTTVQSLRRDHGSNFCNGILKGWLVYINMWLNQKKSMTEDQIVSVSSLIQEDYYWLTFQDISLFFKNLQKSVYGRYYGVFDAPKLMEILDIYANERQDLAEQIQINKHNDFKNKEK